MNVFEMLQNCFPGELKRTTHVIILFFGCRQWKENTCALLWMVHSYVFLATLHRHAADRTRKRPQHKIPTCDVGSS